MQEAVAAGVDVSQQRDGIVVRAGRLLFRATIALLGLAVIAVLTHLAGVAGALLRGGQTVLAWMVIAWLSSNGSARSESEKPASLPQPVTEPD